MRVSHICTSATRGHIVPVPGDDDDGDDDDDDDDEYSVVGGMELDRRNRSTQRKPAPVPLFPPQNPRD
jgi:hypothetical protein